MVYHFITFYYIVRHYTSTFYLKKKANFPVSIDNFVHVVVLIYLYIIIFFYIRRLSSVTKHRGIRKISCINLIKLFNLNYQCFD